MSCPTWLTKGARVRVRLTNGPFHVTETYTVRYLEWPWLVCFEEVPGAMHPVNVIGLEPPTCMNILPDED